MDMVSTTIPKTYAKIRIAQGTPIAEYFHRKGLVHPYALDQPSIS